MLPKLRPLNLRWVQWEGQPVLLLQDPLRLAEDVVMMPRTVAPLLPLLDGTRDLEACSDELEWRFNNRENPWLFRDTLLRVLQSENLPFQVLTEN